jgi:hypothetical protein
VSLSLLSDIGRVFEYLRLHASCIDACGMQKAAEREAADSGGSVCCSVESRSPNVSAW